MSPVSIERHIGRLLALAGLTFILGATLYPYPRGEGVASTLPFWCLVCGDRGGVDVTLNVILFLPFALGLRLAGMSWKRVVGLAALVSLSVEFLQVRFIPGRDASLSDLLTNTTGGVIGATVAPRLRALLTPSPRLAGRLVLGGGILWLTILGGSAWALQPWVPRGPLLGNWDPRVPGREPFAGHVLSAFISGDPLANGHLPDSLDLRRRILAGAISLEARMISGPPVARWSPIVALMSDGDVLASIDEVGRDVVFKAPARSDHLRLQQPGLRLAGVLPRDSGEPIQLAAAQRDLVLRIEATSGGEHHVRALALSPSFGWSLILPFDYAYGPEVRWLTGLWIGGLLLPLGYWAGWARRPRDAWWGARWLFVLTSFVVLGLGVVPWLGGFRPVHWSEWLAAALGAGAGWALARRATYLAVRCASPSASESCSS